jgi:hypothetical protein
LGGDDARARGDQAYCRLTDTQRGTAMTMGSPSVGQRRDGGRRRGTARRRLASALAVARDEGRELLVEERFFGWKRLAEWSLIPLAFVVLQFVPDRPAGVSGWLLLLVAAVLFASPAIFASYREHRKGQAARSAEELAVEYRLRLGLALGEAVIPIGDLLGRIVYADPEERDRLRGQLCQRVVDASAALATAGGTRAVFFALEGRTLRVAAWAGRPEPPVGALVRGAAGGAAAFGLMEGRDRVLVPDIADAEAIDLGLGGNYATYLGVAVYAGTKSFGILSVDAPAPEVLTESDLDVAAALAQMLGPGLAVR